MFIDADGQLAPELPDVPSPPPTPLLPAVPGLECGLHLDCQSQSAFCPLLPLGALPDWLWPCEPETPSAPKIKISPVKFAILIKFLKVIKYLPIAKA
jgi:hypothetical protein